MNTGGLRELALFAGAGGGILGSKLLGWRTVCAVEVERYARNVLLARQNDGMLDPFPVWDDVRTFDGRPWRGLVDVVSGGFPCQDISCAGKAAGIKGERSGLWSEFARIICEVRPRFVFVENSPMLTSRGLDVVLGDLAEMGFDAEWGVLGADDAGAPHRRKRIWIVAHANEIGRDGRSVPAGCEAPQGQKTNAGCVSDAVQNRFQGQRTVGEVTRPSGLCGRTWWDEDPADFPLAEIGKQERGRDRSGRRIESQGDGRVQPGSGECNPSQSFVGRVAHGVANRVDRLKAIGNGQVPAVAALAWEVLSDYKN